MRRIAMLFALILLAANARAETLAVRLDGGAALLDMEGAEIVAFGMFEDIVPLENGMYAAQAEGKYALMDDSGTLLSDSDYERFDYEHGILTGCKDGLWYILDENGAPAGKSGWGMVVPDGFGGAWAIRGSNGDIESDEIYLIDSDGAERASGLFVRQLDDSCGDGLLCVLMEDEDLYGYCDRNGEMAIEAQFETAGEFTGGVAAVSKDGRFGAIAPDGSWILRNQYVYLDAQDGYILALDEKGAVFCAKDGQIIAEHPGSAVSAAFAGEHYLIYDGEQLEIHDYSGRLLQTMEAGDGVYAGLDGQLILSDGAWGAECVWIMGTQKRWQNVFPLGYADGGAIYAYMTADVARYMNNLLGEVQLSTDMDSARYGVLNAEGNLLLPARYARISYLCDDRLLVKTDHQWRLIDTQGRIYWRRAIEGLSPE